MKTRENRKLIVSKIEHDVKHVNKQKLMENHSFGTAVVRVTYDYKGLAYE